MPSQRQGGACQSSFMDVCQSLCLPSCPSLLRNTDSMILLLGRVF